MLLARSFALKLGPDVPGHWFFCIGPRLSYWIGGHGKFGQKGDPRSNYEIVFDEEATGDFTKMYIEDVNRWLFGLDLGVGFDAPIKSRQDMRVELRYASGHTFYGDRNSATNATLGFTDNLRANQKILEIGVSYQFDLYGRGGKKGGSTLDRSNRKNRRR